MQRILSATPGLKHSHDLPFLLKSSTSLRSKQPTFQLTDRVRQQKHFFFQSPNQQTLQVEVGM
jgi:hypothetical protein